MSAHEDLNSLFSSGDVSFTQQQMQDYLDGVSESQHLFAAIEALYQWSFDAGYLTHAKLNDNIRYQYFDPKTQVTFKTQINIARDQYSPEPPTNQQGMKIHCPICFENINRPGRENLRAYEFDLADKRRFFVQFTPFPLFPYHVVVVDRRITPMIMDRRSVSDLVALCDMLPEFTMLSNSDVKGAGASILSHHHYQGGRFLKLPIMEAGPCQGLKDSILDGEVSFSLLNYPISTVRLEAKTKQQLVGIGGRIIEAWKAQKPGENTSNLTCQKTDSGYVLHILFRHPAYLTAPQFQAIKQEYVGIVEVCGEGVYPVPKGPLKHEIEHQIEHDGLAVIKGIIGSNNPISKENYPGFFEQVCQWVNTK